MLLGSEVPFPFDVCTPGAVPHLPPWADAGMEALERIGIASRLASRSAFEGCYPGHVTDLARDWLEGLPPEERRQVAIYACGPVLMLQAATVLAADYSLPAQVCLEEYMACAVGGCAGCAVRIRTPSGPAMQRVCVDGPVFDAHRVMWPRAKGIPP